MTSVGAPGERANGLGGGRVCRKLTMNMVMHMWVELTVLDHLFQQPETFAVTIQNAMRQVRDQTAQDLDHRVNVWMSIRELEDWKFMQNVMLADLVAYKTHFEERNINETLEKYDKLTKIYLELNR